MQSAMCCLGYMMYMGDDDGELGPGGIPHNDEEESSDEEEYSPQVRRRRAWRPANALKKH